MNAIFIVIPILTILMFDLGLTLKPQDFKLIAQRPKPVIVGLVGQIILLPLIAWLIILSPFTSHLSPLLIIGIMLVACSPGGSSSNVFSMLAKGDVALSVTLTACSSLITLLTLPLIMAWVTANVGETTDIHLPIGNLLMQNIVLMVVPVSIGFVVNIFREQAAAKIHNVLKRIAMPALVLLVTVFFFQHKQTMVEEFASLGLTMTVLILATTGCGALLSWLLRLTVKERRTLVIEIGMQNAAQAITIACSPLIFNNEIIAVPAIIYALMMNLILLAYVGITKTTTNMSMKQYKAIFLDWDDTIGDWTTAEHKALQDIYAHYHLNRLYPTFEDYLNAYKPYNLELWGMYGRGEVTKEWLHLQRFLRPLLDVQRDTVQSTKSQEDLAHEMGDEFLRLTNKYFCLMPDAKRVVAYLASKYPLTIISNGFKEVQYYKFEHSGLAPYFTHTLISEEVGINKPQPGIFEIALQRNGITADEAIMVGDSYSSDIAGAKAVGIDQIWIHDGQTEETATYIVTKITDIMKIV